VLVIASTTGALLTGAAGPASAGTGSSMTLSSSLASVHSSTGKSLHVSIYASKTTTSGATTAVAAGVGLQNHTYAGLGETHSWSLQVSRSTFTYNSSTGVARFNTGTQISPLGTMNLTFRKSSSSTTQCAAGGSQTTVRGSLRGKFHFISKTRWGSVGSTTSTFTFPTPNFLSISNNCNVGEGTSICYTNTTWYGPTTGTNFYVNGSVYDNGSTTTSIISGSHGVALTHPSGAGRNDYLSARAPRPTINGSTFNVKTSSGTPVSGSAKLTGGTAGTSHSACKVGRHNRTQTQTTHSGATWSSPAGHHLTFNFQASPDFTADGSGSGFWSVATHN
jgi:hypothetical protein